MNLLFAILIQAPAVPAPQPAQLPVSNIVVERYGLAGKEIVMEYQAPNCKNIYF